MLLICKQNFNLAGHNLTNALGIQIWTYRCGTDNTRVSFLKIPAKLWKNIWRNRSVDRIDQEFIGGLEPEGCWEQLYVQAEDSHK